MEILFFLGRILYGGYFIYNAYNHFKNSAALTEYARSKGIPSPKNSVYLTGALLLIGGAGIVFGVFIKFAIFCLVLFLIPVSILMHNFWKISDPVEKGKERAAFTKNMALLGAAIMMLSILEPWNLSLSF